MSTDGTGVFTIVLAGGEGKRLAPLTADRAKPAVPFGGHYRLIDFALSNLVNANYRRIVVLTQYKSHSLDRHVSTTWRLSPLLGNYVAPVPAQMRRGPRWFVGSADLHRWRGQLDYWIFADGQVGQVVLVVNGEAVDMSPTGLQATIRATLIAIDRNLPVSISAPG